MNQTSAAGLAQLWGRSAQPAPAVISQLPRSWAVPAGARTEGSARTSDETISSPGRPPSRYVNWSVAVSPEAAGRDDERRVGNHQLELLARDRVQQGSEPQAHAGVKVGRVQVQLGGVEQQVEPGERQCAFGDVRGGHVLRVVQQVEGLDAAARAEVEGLGNMAAGGDLDQGGGGLPNPQDVVVAEDAGALVGREVAGHPEVCSAGAGPVLPHGRVPAVRPEVHLRLDQVPARGSTSPSSMRPFVRMPGRAASSVAARCGSARSQRRTTAASAAVAGSPRARPVTISAGMSWSRLRAECAASPSSSATPSTV